MSTRQLPLDAAMTLDEITNQYPETLEVFNRFGMDICCGGGASLAEAAARDGVDVNKVIDALRQVVARETQRAG